MVVILGGGLTGLTAGYELSKKGIEITLIEKSNSIGGVLGSVEINGYQIEKFYHHVFSGDKCFFGLLDELRLRKNLVWKSTKTGFYSKGKFYDLSGAVNLLNFSLLSPADRMKIVLLALKVKTVSGKELEELDNVSAKEWITNNLGERIYRNFFMPLLSSKYGSSLEDVSAAWFLERMKIRANRGLTGEKLGYVEGGFGKVMERLEEKIMENGGKIICGSSAKKIIIKNSYVIGLVHSKGRIMDNSIISTIPPKQLQRISGIKGNYGDKLVNLEYQGCISVLFGTDRKITDFYWSNLIDGNEHFGAIIEHTNFMSPSDYGNDHIVYLASYPPLYSKVWSKNDKDIFQIYLRKLRQLLPEKKFKVKWWEVFSTRDAGLVYKKGIFSSKVEIKTPIKGLFAGGMFNSYPERSINESVRIGIECARLAKEFLER